jgi:hypothetical protein
LPVVPTVLLNEMSPCEVHNVSSVVAHLPGVDNVVAFGAEEQGRVGQEVNAVIQLVMGELGEVANVLLRHDRYAPVRDIWGDFRV